MITELLTEDHRVALRYDMCRENKSDSRTPASMSEAWKCTADLGVMEAMKGIRVMGFKSLARLQWCPKTRAQFTQVFSSPYFSGAFTCAAINSTYGEHGLIEASLPSILRFTK
jgi:hypothetical protein